MSICTDLVPIAVNPSVSAHAENCERSQSLTSAHTEIVSAHDATVPSISPAYTADPGLIESFLAARSEQTRRAYAQDIEVFRAWLGAYSVDDAAARLLANGHGDANHSVR